MARLVWTVIAVDGDGHGHGTCGHEHADADEATRCPWDPEPRPIEPIAYHNTLDEHRHFLALCRRHEPTSCWAYVVPAGVEIATDEPEGWAGAPSSRPWPPAGEEREDFDRSTAEALG